MFATSGKAFRVLAVVFALALASGCGSRGTRGMESAAAVDPAGDPSSADAAVLEPRPEIPAAAAAQWSEVELAMQAGDWVAARLLLEQLTVDYPAFAGPFANLAIVHRRAGDIDAAEAALKAALAIAPNHPAANNELGMLLRERGAFADAEAAYRRAIAGDASYRYAHYNLGVLLDVYLHRQDEAVEHYEMYQRLVTEPDPEVAFWIADLKRRFGIETEPVRLAQEDGA